MQEVIAAFLLSAIKNLPLPLRLDSDQVCYAWNELMFEAGWRGWIPEKPELVEEDCWS